MGMQAGMGVPTTQPDTQSPSPLKQMQRTVSSYHFLLWEVDFTPIIKLSSRQVLKAISLEKPKETRAEIWDVQRLLDWLSTGTQNLSFFEVSRRTALLLLVSGRRIQDLTLLKISKNFLTNLGDTIILWPVFGSKTDRAFQTVRMEAIKTP
ncbi:reverse transcriptase-7 [Lasius niger]|uniref:Reverse transcriptase-7 n=1 Tax=Lasius niger TaxID=67767 RepID=A0A0J7KAN4_LASNI|nr:reverse transcriptase-7 [Lasius niger]